MSDLSLELALRVIPIFDGLYKEGAPFLKCIEVVHKTLEYEAKPDLIEFVFSGKLNNNVRTLLANHPLT